MLWRPPGIEEQDIARWDAEPHRSAYFLELIANEKREGRFLQGNPTNTHYNMFIKAFWERFQVYHTKAQFKNHFTAKKQLWSLVCWAQTCTGISWDHERKMVIASPEWWEANKERKGLSSLRDKPVTDYDLLELVYRGQHAEGNYMHDPRVPRFPRTEVIVDSDQSVDPLVSEPQDPVVSPQTQSGYRRTNTVTPSTERGRKKQKRKTTAESSHVQNHDILDNFFNRMEEISNCKVVGVSNTVDSSSMPPLVAFASFPDAVRVLIEEMKLDVSSELYQDAQEMFLESKDMREVLIRMPQELRWPWLTTTLSRRKSKVATPTKMT